MTNGDLEMLATHLVKNFRGEQVGYIISKYGFYNIQCLKNYISMIDNLELDSNGNITVKNKENIPEYSYRQYKNKIYKELLANNPIERDIQDEMGKWFEHFRNKTLLVRGPRQVGKTVELKKFGYKNYEHVIYIDLLSNSYGFKTIINRVGLNALAINEYCRKANLPPYDDSNKTLIIIDEVQYNKKICRSIHELKNILKCDIAIAGNCIDQLAGTDLISSIGDIYEINMYPLSFREFCRYMGEENSLMEMSLFGSENKDRYAEILELYNIYKQIGGYPEVVECYNKFGNISDCMEIIEMIIAVMEKEIIYNLKLNIDAIAFRQTFKSIVKAMCRYKHGFDSKTLVDDINDHNYIIQRKIVNTDIINWLSAIGFIGVCDKYIDDNINDASKLRKIYFMDCGIANYGLIMSNFPQSSTSGILTENFIYCELYKMYYNMNDITNGNPCYCVYGDYELDFIILDKEQGKIGIEVKTTSGSHKSLNTYLSKKLIDHGIVAKVTKGGHSDKFDTIPIFAVGCRYPYN